MPRRHLDVGVVGADALRPLEQLLCRGRRVLSQQRVRSVSQHLRGIISKLLIIVSNVSSMDTFEFLCSIFFVHLFPSPFPFSSSSLWRRFLFQSFCCQHALQETPCFKFSMFYVLYSFVWRRIGNYTKDDLI